MQTLRRNARAFSLAQWAHLIHYLCLKLSPQQMAGRLKVEDTLSISHEAIYRFIYRNKAQGGCVVQHLRCQKTRRKRYASGQQRRGKLCDRGASSNVSPSLNSEAALATGKATPSLVKAADAGEEDGIGAEGKLSHDQMLTDPVLAKDFVEKTGVRKINIDIRLAMTGAMRQVFAQQPSEFDPRKALVAVKNAARSIVKARFEAFGCAGQGSKITPIALEAMTKRYS